MSDMPGAPIRTLKDVRERLLHYRFESVARLADISRDRLKSIEDGSSAPTVYEAEMLSRIYGIDAERLTEEPITLDHSDSVRTLALLDEFKDLDDQVRARVVFSANAARDLKRLRLIARDRSFDRDTLRLVAKSKDLAPHHQGIEHAKELRQKLKLGTGPIPSMRDLVLDNFPEVTLLYANLTSQGPAGVAFADRLRGKTIVLNLDGKNENPCVRRFSLAHELYHIFMDWNRKTPLGSISGYLSEHGLDTERRANAFAMRFLCPPSKIAQIGRHNATDSSVVDVLQVYGLHYSALRLYVLNQLNLELPASGPAKHLAMVTDPKWFAAENPKGVTDFPLPAVPSERRTYVATYASKLYSEGRISRSAYAEYLGLTPVHDVERVLDFFGLDAPI
jgi:Zn-dependent peptidase ImmA (M78 family)